MATSGDFPTAMDSRRFISSNSPRPKPTVTASSTGWETSRSSLAA